LKTYVLISISFIWLSLLKRIKKEGVRMKQLRKRIMIWFISLWIYLRPALSSILRIMKQWIFFICVMITIGWNGGYYLLIWICYLSFFYIWKKEALLI